MFGALNINLPKFGDGIGLARIKRFFAEMQIDEARLASSSAVVVGSNGKGSTARFTQSLMAVEGRRVGLFTSPHMFDWRERFLIGEERISEAAFERHGKTVLAFNARLAEGDKMGAFEFLFLVAVLWFEEQTPDAMVWEAGIGGRFDPVRAVTSSAVALTAIELEHTQLLGASEELIAYDKIDALAPGGALVVSPSVPAHLRERIAAYADLGFRSARFVADTMTAESVTNSVQGARFAVAGGELQLGLIGRHQADNALTALALSRVHRDGTEADLAAPPTAAEREALSATRWAGRLEQVASGPDLWIDVGHTPRAVELVTEAFADIAPRAKTLAVFGVSAAKEVSQIAAIVAARFDHVVLTQAHKAGADPAAFAAAFAGKDVVIEPDLGKAVALAKSRAASEGLTVLALGGLFLSAEVQRAWEGGDPNALEFF